MFSHENSTRISLYSVLHKCQTLKAFFSKIRFSSLGPFHYTQSQIVTKMRVDRDTIEEMKFGCQSSSTFYIIWFDFRKIYLHNDYYILKGGITIWGRKSSILYMRVFAYLRKRLLLLYRYITKWKVWNRLLTKLNSFQKFLHYIENVQPQILLQETSDMR